MRIHKITDWPGYIQDAAHIALGGEMVSGLLCPTCKGGESGERSLSVFPGDNFYVVAKCWRSSCGYVARAFAPGVKIERPSFMPHYYKGTVRPFSRQELDDIMSRWGVHSETLEQCNIMLAEYGAATWLHVPIYGPNERATRGCVLRLLDGTSKQKALTFKHTDRPLQGWFYNRKDFLLGEGMDDAPQGPIVVVEDVLSAMRVYQAGGIGVALLGVNLTQEKYDEISRYAGDRRIVLALDKDASERTISYVQKWRRLEPALLAQDLKDSTDEYVTKTLNGWR